MTKLMARPAAAQQSDPAREQRGQDTFEIEPWLEALRKVGQHYRLPLSAETVRQAARWDRWSGGDLEKIRNLARSLGLRVKVVEADAARVSNWHLPLVVQLEDGQVGVVTTLGASGQASVAFSGDKGLERPVVFEEFMRDTRMIVIPRPARAVPDARVDAYIQPYRENWLRRIVVRDLRPYGHILIASLIANSLSLTGIMFSMQVYDRVVPAQSYQTLFVLFSGVLLAILFDFVMRRLRMNIIDLLGKRADIRMSDQVFGHALRVRNSARPSSTGAFVAQLRDLEQVREIMTSTAVGTFADIPFFLLFLFVLWHIGGILALVPVCAVILLAVPGLFLQRRLRAYSVEAMRESSLRNAMLFEAVQGIEDIKTLQAEERFQQQWNHFNAVSSEAHVRQRAITNSLSAWAHNIQMGVYACTVFFGAPMVIAGDMTTGALVGASMLGSRMISPMAQFSHLLNRWQQAKVAKRSLDRLMQMPVDHPDHESRIHCPRIAGRYDLKSTGFCYASGRPPALFVRDLHIAPGDRIAVLGKNGAGKSTLLQALSGLLEPASGEVLLDNMSLQHIDPADVRRDVGYLSQNARLFYGTIRDNVTLGAPMASEDEIRAALAMVGAEEFIRKMPKGLDTLLFEGGQSLSGGQRQALLLARVLIRQPNVVLLDEPTASMDEATERQFIKRFLSCCEGRTVIIATHRMRVLELVSRLIVVENGQIALDDSKESGLLKLRGLANVSGSPEPRQ